MTETSFPRVSVGFVSCNRLQYLRAAIQSARRCIQYPNLEWLIVDNASTEPGLRDYVASLDWVDVKVQNKERHPRTEHMAALNTIVSRATGEYLVMLSDDIQFIVEGHWMQACVDVLQQHRWITSVALSTLRKTTVDRSYGWRAWLNYRAVASDLKRYGRQFRTRRTIIASDGTAFRSFGFMRPPIDGVGMISVTPISVWKRVGPWQAVAGDDGDMLDSSGGGEVDMLARAVALGVRGHMVMPIVPVLATILTDDVGTNAKVRGNTRFGDYRPPVSGPFYYRICSEREARDLAARRRPVGFEELIEPIGFALPVDEDGSMRKVSINTEIQHPLE